MKSTRQLETEIATAEYRLRELQKEKEFRTQRDEQIHTQRDEQIRNGSGEARIRAVAAELHDRLCGHNHIDYCSGESGPRTTWYEVAAELLEKLGK